MPFDLGSAIAIREREDGLLEKDTFDLGSAVPFIPELRAIKPEERKYEPPLTEEQKAQAVVELTYREKGEEVPFGLRTDWVLTSPKAEAITEFALVPELTILKGIRGAIDTSGGYDLIDRVQRGILQSEDTKRFYEYIPGIENMPKWAKITADIGEDIVALGLLGLGKAALRKELLTRNISRRIDEAATKFTDDAMSKYMPSGYKSEEVLRQSLEQGYKNRLLSKLTAPNVPSATEGTLGVSLETEIEPSILENYASRKSLFSLLQEEIGIVRRGSVIIPKLGQTVQFTNPEGIILKGIIKEIIGQRAIIEMDGRQVVAILSQLSIPEVEVPTGEGKVYYTGGKELITDFTQKKTLRTGEEKLGTHFTTSEDYAKTFAGKEGKITAVNLDIKKPYNITKENELLIEAPYSHTSFIKELKNKGYDAIVLKGQERAFGKGTYDQVFVLDPSIIKLSQPTGEIIEPSKPSVIPTSKVKGVIRATTGQVKVGDIIEESKALKRLFQREAQISKEFQKEKTTALEQEFANEDLLVREYERDIAKLEKQIVSGEYQIEAEKAKAQVKLENLKQKYDDIQENRKQKLALRNEVANLVESIESAPAENIAIEYQELINNLKAKFDLRNRTEKTIARRESMKAFVERMKIEGRPIDIPAEKLAMLEKVNLKDMTLDQLRQVKQTIDDLSRLGKTKLKAREAVYESTKEKTKIQLMQTVTPINSTLLPKVPIGDKVNSWVERCIALQNYAQKTGVGLTPIDGLADVTGMQEMKKVLDADFSKYLIHNDEAIQQWYNLTKDFTDKEFERIGVIAASRQEGGLERLANNGITKAEVDAIKLTPEEEAAYQFVLYIFDKEFPAVKQYSKEVYNADVGEQENYVSFMSDYELMSDLEIYQRFGQTPEQIANRKTKTVEQGFTKERAKISKIKLETNIDKIFRRHLDDVAYMLNTGKNIKMYFEIVNSPEMREKLGDVGTLAWLQWLDLMARKGGTEGAKRIAALDILRQNIGAGVLSFRLSSALVQFSSFADTIATIGVRWATKGATNISTSKEWRNFIMDNFPEIKKAVGDDIAFREFGEGFFGNMARTGLKPLQVLDGIMRSTAASGSYEKLCSEKGIAVDLKNPNPGLIIEATRLMRESQGSSFFKDQPLAITAGYGLTDNKSLNKTILTFQSFMLNRWDNINRQIWRMGIKEKDYGKTISSFFWLLIFAGAVEEGIRRGSRKITNAFAQDKKKEESFVSGVVLNMVQSVPLLGQLVSAITYSSNPVPVINTLEDILEGAGRIVKGKTIETKLKGLIITLGAAGSLLGIPGASQAAQIGKGLIPKNKKGRSSSTRSSGVNKHRSSSTK